jgi:hypothetical protein
VKEVVVEGEADQLASVLFDLRPHNIQHLRVQRA